MMMTLLILSMTVAAMSMPVAMNPLTMGMLILLMALLLAMTFAYSMSSWMAFLIFLIYIGGMLVMFSYFVSIVPNQNISFSYNFFIMMSSLSLMWLISLTLNIKPVVISSQPLHINIMYLTSNIPTLLFLATLLLFTMIVVVKLTILSKGPLRPFSMYV